MIDVITWHDGTPYHAECTHGPGYPAQYTMTTWPSTLTEDDVRRIVREELAHNAELSRPGTESGLTFGTRVRWNAELDGKQPNRGDDMNLDDVKKSVARIEAIKGDDECAHVAEDALYALFIQHVADTAGSDLAEMAREVLKTADIDFARWCA